MEPLFRYVFFFQRFTHPQTFPWRSHRNAITMAEISTPRANTFGLALRESETINGRSTQAQKHGIDGRYSGFQSSCPILHMIQVSLVLACTCYFVSCQRIYHQNHYPSFCTQMFILSLVQACTLLQSEVPITHVWMCAFLPTTSKEGLKLGSTQFGCTCHSERSAWTSHWHTVCPSHPNHTVQICNIMLCKVAAHGHNDISTLTDSY